MELYRKMTLKHHRFYIIVLLSILFMSFLSRNAFLFGLLLGLAVSYLNLCLLHVDVRRIGTAHIKKQRFFIPGIVFRLSAVVALLYVVTVYFKHVPLHAVVLGLMFKYVVVIVVAFLPGVTQND